MAAKILGPLTANVIGNENPGEYDPRQHEKNNPIHITVPEDQGISLRMILQRMNLLFT